MLKILDRYILTRFIVSLIVVTLAVIFLIVAINMVEQLRDFIDHDVPTADIMTFYVYYSGWALKTFLPVFVFLAGLFTVGTFARSNELKAIKAAGVSLYRFAVPLVVFTAILTAIHFYYSEYVFPSANKRLVEIKEFSIDRHSRSSYINRNNLYRQISDSAYFIIDMYSVPDRTGYGIKLFRRDRNMLGEFITAKEMHFVSGMWILYDGSMRSFSDTGEVFTHFDSLHVPIIQDQPSDFERRLGKPEDMGYEELEYYINLMKRIGAPYQQELVDLKVKMSFPFTSLVVIFLCVPLAANPRRAGIAGPLASAAGMILLYFVSFKVMKSLGGAGVVPADFAAWSVNGFFFLLAIGMNIFARK